MSFEACERSNLMHSVPLPRFGIAGAVAFEMSYLIDLLPFRLNFNRPSVSVSVVSVVFRGVPIILIYYITYYLLISYNDYKEGFDTLLNLKKRTETETTETHWS